MDLIQFLEDNDLEDFIKKYFNGDSQSFMKFLQSKNLIEEMMDHLIKEGYLTDVMTIYYEENPKFVIEFLLGYLDDVTMEGGKYWMTIDREDMSKFFANDREDSNEVESQEVEIDGVKDIVTVDVINNMDDDKLSKFIKENSPDVLSELENIHRNAEESAIYDELYNDVMNGLRYLFDEHFFSREIPYKRKTYKAGTNEPIEVQDFHYQVDVTKLLPQVVKTVLSWGGYSSDNDFEYYGSLESLLEYYLDEEGELIRVSWPEWADDEIVREYINDNFQDYL
jgi:hypothetical protein